MKPFFWIYLLLPLFCGQFLRAQERDDFGIWSQIDLSAKFGGQWSGGLWFEHRSKEDARTLDCALGPRSTLDLFYLYYVMAGAPNRERHVLGLGYAFKI